MTKDNVINKITSALVGNKEDKQLGKTVEDKGYLLDAQDGINPSNKEDKPDNKEDTEDEETDEEKDQEDERIQADYMAKIEALDELLNNFKASKLDEDKRAAMTQAKYSDEQIERYINHITGDGIDEIKQSVEALKSDFKPDNIINYVDPSLSNSGIEKGRIPKGDGGFSAGRELVKQANKRKTGGRYYG